MNLKLKPLSEVMASAKNQPSTNMLNSSPPSTNVSLPPKSISVNPTPSPTTDQLQVGSLASTAAQTELSFASQRLIGPNDRVLHIGDSHTVGIYGQEMDKHLRSTGAKVETYGSAGSSPQWWLTGQATRSGFFGKDETGKTDAPRDWKQPHATPKLPNLMQRFQPNVVVFSLGANLLGANAETIEKQVKSVAEIAKANGAKIIWVGPPDGRESKKPSSKQNALYQALEKAASQYGTFIDSRPLTEYPATGGDGVHYWGKEGSKTAKSWASHVFEQIQDSGSSR